MTQLYQTETVTEVFLQQQGSVMALHVWRIGQMSWRVWFQWLRLNPKFFMYYTQLLLRNTALVQVVNEVNQQAVNA